MEAMHINTKPHALLSEDVPARAANPLQLAKSSGDPAARQRAVSEAGISSGPAATKPTHSPSRHHSRDLPSSSSSSFAHPALFPFGPHSSAGRRPHPLSSASLLSLHPPFSLSQQPPLRSLPVAPALSPSLSPSLAVSVKHISPGTAVSATATTSQSPLFFGPSHRTTPETSLVGASGEYITAVDDSTVAHRASALRELNSSFPSPVFRHRHTKSAGAQSTTYSQPVIVRTYTGPPPSPSTSAHCHRPSSSHRTDSRVAASRRIPLASTSRAAVSSSTLQNPAVNSSENAAGSGGWALTNSLFGMARSKAGKGSFFPWPWTSNSDNAPTPDEAKLPPLEAFTFKGFMADLQTTTDIRADLDRIAEICARSRYSLSNQYEAHMAPHGSGAGFAASAGQRSKGRRKGTSSPGGPTLQAVPSDEDEGPSRGQRRRRGGIGGGRRRSAAYGTLETIMSSSRSSEEDKTKKKSAAEIADEVRGRPARKTIKPDSDSPNRDTGSSEIERASGSGSSGPPKDHQRKGTSTLGEDPASTTSKTGKRDKGKAVNRPKSTTFAHAVMDSSRHKLERHTSKGEGGRKPSASVPTNPSAVPALLGEPALPYTTDGSADVYSASGSVSIQSIARSEPRRGETASSRRQGVSSAQTLTRAHRSGLPVHVVNTEDEGFGDASQLLPLSSDEPTEAGFMSGVTHWIPWVAGSGLPHPSLSGQHPPFQSDEIATSSGPGPSHAEGRLRELLKSVETSSAQDKGKVVDVDG